MAFNIPDFSTIEGGITNFLSSNYAKWFLPVGQTLITSILDVPKYDIWLKQGNLIFRFPLLPSSFNVSNTAQNKTYNIEGLGEITQIKSPNPLIFNFSSHFPKYHFTGCQYATLIDPKIVVTLIEHMKRTGPVRLIITGTPINMLCSIESFPFEERGGDVDSVYYSLSFKEYKNKQPRNISVRNGTAFLDNKAVRISDKIKSTTATTGAGDNLYKIAQKQLGDGSKWAEIAKKNNLKRPYKLIPGQKLVVK